MIQRYTIKQVVQATGLEECEIRFFEQVFREYLTFSQLNLDQNEFNQDHVDVLLSIKRLIHEEGRSISEVKRELKEALEASASGGGRPAPNSRARRRHARVIAVTSGKGGVGKTVLTVNLATAFARMGQRVAVFDADLGLANVHLLMGVKPKFNIRHVIEDDYRLEDIVSEGPEGIKIISGGQGVREMANLTQTQRRAVLRQFDRLEREVDILMIDTGAGISENVLRFATFADEVIAVTTPNIASAADVYSIIKIILQMEPRSRIGLVSNMVKNMYQSKNVFNRINAATLKYLNHALTELGYVVQDYHVEAASQARRPLQLHYPACEAATCIRAIAEAVLYADAPDHEPRETSFADVMGALKRTVVGV